MTREQREKDFEKAAEKLADTKRTNEAKQQCLYDFSIAVEYGYQYALQHPQWIPVEERLPEEKGKYMFRLSNGDMYYETYYPNLKLMGNVTHWMEIHPPRKEAKDETD